MDIVFQEMILFRDFLGTHPLFTFGIMLVIGYYMGKLVSKIGLPEITGFIVAGLLMGESVIGLVPHHMEESLKSVTEVALGLIALTIGGEFYWVKLKRLGKEIVIITVVQIVLTFGAVAAGMMVLNMDWPFALMLGAIAAATAPAATVAIVQSLRAHGLFVDYLYGVVALDDAGCVILFGVVFAMAGGMLGDVGHSAGIVVAHAFGEVGLSLLLGAACGVLVHLTTRRKSNENEILIITIGLVFLFTAMAILFHLSPLLSNMTAGALIINLSPRNHRIFKILEPLTPPIYALFFIIAGTELQPGILLKWQVLAFGGVYILARAIGKYGGVYLGCALSRSDAKIRKYLGFCMLPQAGVAIGLVLLIQASPLTSQLSEAQVAVIDLMVNVVLLSVFVNEMIGPPLSKFAVVRGNEMEE